MESSLVFVKHFVIHEQFTLYTKIQHCFYNTIIFCVQVVVKNNFPFLLFYSVNINSYLIFFNYDDK